MWDKMTHFSIHTNFSTYDPFVRGRFPVGVRTIHAMDKVRDRTFPCEVWYPASTPHAGQDFANETRDSFEVAFPPNAKARNQMAVRDATADSGTYPLIVFSHSSGGDRRQSTFLCTHLSTCTNSSNELLQQSKWSFFGAPITCISWTMSNNYTKP